jgi:hypothetical protein
MINIKISRLELRLGLLLSTIIIIIISLLAPPLFHHGYAQIKQGVSILSSSSFKDNLGYFHIVGEVKNNSTIDSLNYVKIVSTFYDDKGRFVGTDFAYSNVDILRPAEKSSFKIVVTDVQQSEKISNYKLSVSADKTQPLPASLKLNVGDSHMDATGAYHIVGEVTNQGNGKATFVKVSGAFYNDSNSVVATDFTFTEPICLEPGQTASFEIIVHAPTANEITSASLNVNSNQYSSMIENKTA